MMQLCLSVILKMSATTVANLPIVSERCSNIVIEEREI